MTVVSLRFNLLSNSKKEELIRLDIQQLMDEMTEYAKEQGLTEEILDKILNEI